MMKKEHYELFKSDDSTINQNLSKNNEFWRNNPYFQSFETVYCKAIKSETGYNFSKFVKSHLTKKI